MADSLTHPQNSILRMRETSLDDVRKLATGGHLYAIVDACNVPMVAKKVLELGEQRAISLYRGSAEEDFWDVAPYLMKLDGALLDWILANGSKEGWGIFVASKADVGTLRYHFRHFLKVQEPKGEVWFFRFYDPRVLEVFLATCLVHELRVFFGPVTAYGVLNAGKKRVDFFRELFDPAATDESANYQFLFRFRVEQLDAFRLLVQQDFVTRLCHHLREFHASVLEGLPDEALRQRIAVGIARGQRYGLTWESSLAGFVALMFEFAPNFDEHTPFQRVLRDPYLLPDKRLDELIEISSEQDWEIVERAYDSGAWITA